MFAASVGDEAYDSFLYSFSAADVASAAGAAGAAFDDVVLIGLMLAKWSVSVYLLLN